MNHAVRVVLFALLLSPLSCFGQSSLFRIQKFCELGGQTVTTQGLQSVTKVQRSFPSCTVTVYLTGTTTVAAIYSDNLASPTPLANPFTANVDGSFGLYAASSACYDVVTSGASIPTPFTYSDICNSGGGQGGGGVSGTPPHVAKFTGTTAVGDSSGLDPGNTPTQWPLGLNVIGGAGYLQDTVGATGVSANLLVEFDTNSNIVTASVSSAKPKGIADVGGASGASVPRAVWGRHSCVFDGQTALNDFVAPSATSAGDCSDVGATKPNNVVIIGTVTSVNGGAGTLANVDLLPWDTVAPGSSGGSGTVSSCGTANSNAYYSAIGTIVVCDASTTDDGAGNMTMKSAGFTDTAHAGFWFETAGPTPAAAPVNSTQFQVGTTISAPNTFQLPVAAGAADVNKVWGVTSSTTDTNGNPVDVMGVVSPAAICTTCLTVLPCQSGIGDGLNAVPAGTYLQSFCYNDSGATLTITGIKCYTDDNGSSTLSATNGAGTALLTGAVTCTNSWAAGTQSGTVTIASGDYIKFTFVSVASKQTSWAVTFTK